MLAKRILIFSLGSILSMIAQQAMSLEFEHISVPQFSQSSLVLIGPIEPGDSELFRDRIEGLENITITLESPGGIVSEALDIGAQIQIRGFVTQVLPQGECYSACALIWVSGVRRYLDASSIIGVHAAYRVNESGTADEIGVANADIGAYLNMIGLRREAIRYFTTASPDEFLRITPGIARHLGIEVYETDGLSVITPKDLPSLDRMVYPVAHIGKFVTECAWLFSADEAALRAQLETRLKRAREVYGGERSGNVLIEAMAEYDLEIERTGWLKWCLGAEQNLRNSDVETAILGPGFNCSKANTPNEKLICRNIEFWALDRAITTLYGVFRKEASPLNRENLVNTQRAWIKYRDWCENDIACTRDAYMKRLDNFVAEGSD